MPIFASMIAVENEATKQIFIVQRDYQLASVNFMMKNQVKNTMKFLVRQSFPCVEKNSRASVVHQDKMCHIQMSSKKVAAYAIVGKQYEKKEYVIFGYLNKVLEIFFAKMGDKWKNFTADQNLQIPEIIELFNKYQNPADADKLSAAQKKVEQTKVVLYDSVKKLLERQGDLDKLVQKSNDLSQAAKQFHKTTKKMDKGCCQLI